MATVWFVLLIILWGFVLLEGLLLFGILRQFGLLYHRVDTLANTHPPVAQGLMVGTSSPDFTLDRVGGGQVCLRDYLGHPLILAFVSPGCAPCERLLPHLDALLDRPDLGGLQVLLISQGSPETNEKYRERHQIRCPLLLQTHREVMGEYLVTGTPYVYGIDPEGTILQAGVANSAEQLERLLPLSNGATKERTQQGSGASGARREVVSSGVLGLQVQRSGVPTEGRRIGS